MLFDVESIENLAEVSDQILAQLSYPIVLLKGDLGAGKTTLVKSLLSKINEDADISSPTFSLVNDYSTSDKSIFHLDLYRIESLDEALDMGIEEYLDMADYIFIEWPELITQLLDVSHHLIEIKVLDNSIRRIKLH